MHPDRAALYDRFVQLRADLTVLGNMLQSDPQAPRMHTLEDVQQWAAKGAGCSEKLDALLGDTHTYLTAEAGPRSRM